MQPINESGGVRNDWAREKKAKPIIYAAARMANSHGEVIGRVSLMRAVSAESETWRLWILYFLFRSGCNAEDDS